MGYIFITEMKFNTGQPNVLLDNAVLYPNPYIVITPKGYTKHYYANGERLATVLGQGGFGRMYSDVISHFNDTLEENLWGSSFKRYENEYPFEYFHETYPVTNPNVDIADRYIPELEYQCGEYHLSGLKLQWDKNILLYTIEAFQTVNDKETDIFYTHNNHLGSAAWITRNDGIPVQYMHYLPYGQLLANQTPTLYAIFCIYHKKKCTILFTQLYIFGAISQNLRSEHQKFVPKNIKFSY